MEIENFTLETVDNILKEYGSGLFEDGVIKKNTSEGRTGVRVCIRGKRLRKLIFVSHEMGYTLAQGSCDRRTVEGFVEKFWEWKKTSKALNV
jgi:hypothetical protein